MPHPDKQSNLTRVIARRSRSNLILFVFLLLVFAVYFGQAEEQKKIKVAVLPPSASGDASPSIAQGLTSVIVTELSRTPKAGTHSVVLLKSKILLSICQAIYADISRDFIQ